MQADILFDLAKITAVFLLVLANGFFVAAEFSLVGIRRSRVGELVAEGSATARALQSAVADLDFNLAATQLGVTLSSLALGWIGEPAIADLIEPALAGLPGASAAAHAIAVVIAFATITTLHIVLGELAPKSLALQRTERTALVIVRPLSLFRQVFRPAIYVLDALGAAVLRLFGLEPGSAEEALHSTEELKLLVAASKEGGLIETAQQEVVERAFSLSEFRVRSIMTPRRKVVWVNTEDDLHAQMATVRGNKHEMAIVARGKLDTLLGVVRKQDLLDAHLDGRTLDPLAVLRDPVVVHDGATVLHVLELFKNRPVQMAVVIDEHAVVQGIVTQTDLLEAMAGDIPEEDETQSIVERADGSLHIEGTTPVLAVMQRLGLSKASFTGEYHTLAGFCLHRLGDVPVTGVRFAWEGWRFEVMGMDGLRIDKVSAVRAIEEDALPPAGGG